MTRTDRGLVVIGALLVVTAISLAALENDAGETPRTLGTLHGFASLSGIIQAKARSAVESAEADVLARFATANRWQTGGKVIAWIETLLTAGLAVIAGLHGRFVKPVDVSAAAEGLVKDADKSRFARWIGAVAALAAVCSILAGKLQGEAVDTKSRAERIFEKVNEVRRELSTASDDEAHRLILVLSKLESE